MIAAARRCCLMMSPVMTFFSAVLAELRFFLPPSCSVIFHSSRHASWHLFNFLLFMLNSAHMSWMVHHLNVMTGLLRMEIRALGGL
jgi:hypothetical protein